MDGKNDVDDVNGFDGASNVTVWLLFAFLSLYRISSVPPYILIFIKGKQIKQNR